MTAEVTLRAPNKASVIEYKSLFRPILTTKQNISGQKSLHDRNRAAEITPPHQTPEINAIPTKEMFDPESGKFYFRCTCGEYNLDQFLVQCDDCGNWMHASCVCYGESVRKSGFSCPFCYQRPIKCDCNEPRDYSEPLIQCKRCEYWVHRSCAGLGLGKIPPYFICRGCGGGSDYSPGFIRLNKLSPKDTVISPTSNVHKLIKDMPEGVFKNFLLADLEKSEWSFEKMMERYFNGMIASFFSGDKAFWSYFVRIFSSEFGVEVPKLLEIIDNAAISFLYDLKYVRQGQMNETIRFDVSERAEENIKVSSLPNVHNARLVQIKNTNAGIISLEDVEEGALIGVIPGIICHYSEIEASTGLRLTWIGIQGKPLVIETEKHGFPSATAFRRSFHHNVTAKLIRTRDGLRVGLYGHRVRGPFYDLPKKKGVCINAGDQLVLPLDGSMPYAVPRSQWFDHKASRRKPMADFSGLDSSDVDGQ